MLTKEQAYPLPFIGQYLGFRARFKLHAPFQYRNGNISIDVPIEAKTDGGSIPPAVYSIIGGPWSIRCIEPVIIHDWECHLAVTVEDRVKADNNLLVGMRICKENLWRRQVIWRSVKAQAWWLHKIGKLK